MNSTPSIETNDPARFDVREIPCRVKHGLIFQRWTELPIGGHFVLVNDHDPMPLYYQFDAQFPGAFAWEYLERRDEQVQVKITRLAETVTPAVLATPGRGCGSHAAGAPPAPLLDLRGLEPPEPMLNILAALEVLAPGRELRALTDRKPVHLLDELTTRGIAHASEEQADGSWLSAFRKG